MSQVTISDVAEEAGLSSSSVSRILRGGKGHVYSAATVERVHEIASRLGYRANAAARFLSRGTQTMIGMSVHFTEHPYLNRFLVAVHRELLNHDYDPVLLDSNHLSSETTAQPFPPPHMLAGLISTGIDLQGSWPRHYASLAEHIPIVAVQPVSTEAAAHVDVVQVDCKNAYQQTIKYLTAIGHRNIAYLGVLENCFPSDSSKLAGWIDAMESHRLSAKHRIPWPIEKPHAERPHTDVENESEIAVFQAESDSDFIYEPTSRQAVAEVVKKLTSFPNRITALVCASDEVALVLQSYLQAIGWSLPRDLSIIGYDGISLGAHVYPSLTTIAPNYDRMAQHAVNQLLYRIEDESRKGDERPQEVFIEPHLLIRESSGPLSSMTA
jgi:DNA-binding LacI/PurR family transcriptional regulator